MERQLDVFEDQLPPSYPLLVSLDGCTAALADEGEALFAAWRQRLGPVFGRRGRAGPAAGCSAWGADAPGPPPRRSLPMTAARSWVNGGAAGLTGAALAETLRRDWGFETEMACGANLLAMTSVADAPAALDRLAEALAAIDRDAPALPGPAAAPRCRPPGPAVCPPAEALARPRQLCPADRAVGAVAAEYVWGLPARGAAAGPRRADHPRLFAAAAAGLEAAGTRLHHTVARTPGTLAVLADPDPAAPGTR